MGSKTRVILYEGTDSDKSKEVRRTLSEEGVEYHIGFGSSAKFQDTEYPIVSVDGMDLYGLEAIEGHSFR